MAISVPGVTQGSEAVFPKAEFDGRIAKARAVLEARGLDLLIVTGPENIFYLCGQQTPGYYTFQALILPLEGEPVAVVRQLEMANFLANSNLDRIEPYQDNDNPCDFLVEALRQNGWVGKRVGIDKRGYFLPIGFYEQLSAALGELQDGSGVVESLRKVKSPLELEKMRQAARYADAAQNAAAAALAVGASENDIVSAMVGATIKAGSEYVGMEPLVASGPRGGVPHATWRRRRLEAGDGILLEPSGCHDRYHAILMRTGWVGPVPDDAAAMYAVCQEGLEAALAALKPGALCEDAHNACQAVIDKAGLTDAFRKRVGYSVGIAFPPDWGEGNILSLFTGVREEVVPGMCFHLPVAVRKWGVFTVGVSETVIVTEQGAEPIGTVGREMFRA